MSRKTWGWSSGGVAPTHMNSLAPISITETPGSLWKWGTIISVIGPPQAAPRRRDHSRWARRGADFSGEIIRLTPTSRQRPAWARDPVNTDRAYWIARSSRAMTETQEIALWRWV